MRLVQFTAGVDQEKALWVNPNHVTRVYVDDNHCTCIEFIDGEAWNVEEPMLDVIKVLQEA